MSGRLTIVSEICEPLTGLSGIADAALALVEGVLPICRRFTVAARLHPHLNEVDVALLGVVELAVQDTGARAHVLHAARRDDALMAH